ncbi:MAG: molybdopterin molybdotransferase MoeA [Gammaproteobacteria bacterium]|jgi:molybdopterin molybdotransferase
MNASCTPDSVTLTAFEDALEQLLGDARPCGETETVALAAARDRVLATRLYSDINVPPADNSAMDGYAMASQDYQAAGEYTVAVSQRIAAGQAAVPLEAGTAARIFTGAPLPAGADTVLMQEHCIAGEGSVTFTAPLRAGANVRRAGEDIAARDAILEAGQRLRPQDIGLAASVGIAGLPVYRRVRVASLFTGDELVEPGRALAAGQIYNSNRYLLNGMLEGMNCELLDHGPVPDNLEATRQAVTAAARTADLVVTSGGVSVGEEDYVRLALEDLGELRLWRIAVKPGKPLAYARVQDTPFIGLPGNPVSAFVTFCLFVRPFVHRLQGRADVLPRGVPVPAAFEWRKSGKRREYLRARLVQNGRDGPHLEIYPNQGSGVLTSTCWADGLAEIPVGTSVAPGDTVRFYPFSELLA